MPQWKSLFSNVTRLNFQKFDSNFKKQHKQPYDLISEGYRE